MAVVVVLGRAGLVVFGRAVVDVLGRIVVVFGPVVVVDVVVVNQGGNQVESSVVISKNV